MKTPEEKVIWAGQFIKRDLQHLNDEDRQELQKDIQEFVQWSDDIPQKWEDSCFTPDTLLSIQKECYSLLYRMGWLQFFRRLKAEGITSAPFRTALLQKPNRTPRQRYCTPWPHTFPTMKGWILMSEPGGGGSIHLDADLPDVFLFALASAVVAVDIDKLRLCPECQAPFFIQHGAQQYCSTQCKNRVSWQRFRERQKQEKAKRKGGGKNSLIVQTPVEMGGTKRRKAGGQNPSS